MKLSFKRKITTIILKLIVIIAALIGIILSATSSSDAFMGGSTVFMYFTIQSNLAILLIALIGLCLILLKKDIKYVWYVIKLVGTVSISITGLVFCSVLAPTMESGAWKMTNVLTHVVVPLSAIIDFFVVGIYTKYRRIDILYVVIPPILYLIYACIGYVADWKFTNTTNYPYFFLNWGSKAGAFGFSSKLPYIGVVWWILLLLGLVIGLGYLYLFIINKLRKKYVEL